MKLNVSLARFFSIVIVVALLSAACAPIPLYPPSQVTPTTSVFLPGAQAPGSALSPLQPATVLTATVSQPPTISPTVTLIAPASTPSVTLAGPVWEWMSSTFSDGTVLAPSDPSRYTFQLVGDGNGLVQADCNFGSAAYQESGDELSFTAVGTTKIACPADSLDSAFLAQLRNSASYAIETGELVITLKDEAGTMRLRAAPAAGPLASPAPLPAETSLPATEVPPTPAATPTIVPSPMPTRVPTDTPTAVPSDTPTSVSAIAPTTVPLPTPVPVLLGTPVPAPTVAIGEEVLPPLGGTSWLLVSLTANDQSIPPIGTAPASLEVDPGGSYVSGSTGCNLYRATLNRGATGAAIVAPALMTQKTCAANLLVQEVEFIDSLLRTRSYVVRGNELVLLDSAGKALLVLARK